MTAAILTNQSSSPNERNSEDISTELGIATTRVEDRIFHKAAQVKFENSQSVWGGGVLFLLPSLLLQGLLKTKEVYKIPSTHYYGIEQVVLTLAFMALLRIKNPEQTKQCKVGEIGRALGIDRIPEVRCLRNKLKLLTEQQQAARLNTLLIDHWYEYKGGGEEGFLYIDGHQRIYYGTKANLPSKYISRQKLCLSASTEYWVNDAQGMPVMVVMGELTEKLEQAIEDQIIPQLKNTVLLKKTDLKPNEPVCTLVFDREAYHPEFFHRLWEKHKIAVITYRKNVRDIWPNNWFKTQPVKVLDQTVNMQIGEMGTYLDKYWFREIRRKSENGHQTSIITTNPNISTQNVAGKMFTRWSQENFFKYMISDYDFDKMLTYGIESVDPDKLVVNPQYRKLTHQLKKVREKKQRIEAKFYPLAQQVIDQPIDSIPSISIKQIELQDQIKDYQNQESLLMEQRKSIKPKITISSMPYQIKYNKLKSESKLLMNVLKMIAYRAESAVVSLIAPYLSKAEDEKRMIVKQIIAANADIEPDYINNTLTITLHSLSANRFNVAAHNLASLLNDTQTIFPSTNLQMIFKISAPPDCVR